MDGELVVLDDQGKPEFEALRRRALMTRRSRTRHQQAARIFAFDIL